MSIDMTQFHQVFFEQTEEHLATMESVLLAVDLSAPDDEDLNAIFRAAHSIKGGAATFGFADLAELTHVLENLLDRVRKGSMALTASMVDLFLTSKDVLQGMLAAHRGGPAVPAERVADVAGQLARLAAVDAEAPVEAAAPVATVRQQPEVWTLLIELDADEKAGIPDLLASLATHGALDVLMKGNEETAQPWVVRFTSALGPDEVSESLAFAIAPDKVRISLDGGVEDDGEFGLFLDNSLGSGALGPAASYEDDGFGLFEPLPSVEAAGSVGAQEEDGFGLFEPLPAAGTVGQGDVAHEEDGFGLFVAVPPPPAQTAQPERPVAKSDDIVAPAARPQAAENSIRVNIEKVDLLLNLVGELVITQSMLTQSSQVLDPALHERLLGGINALQRNSRELQEAVMSIRMTPIAFVFNRFPRVVRDLAGKLGKQVELKTVGENTELDKGFIEKLADPLTHLVRNSLDHGIESPEVRLAKGKSAAGRLTLRAFHQGGSIVIEVTDDGAGLPRERILAKARERGMTVADTMSDVEVWNLIFEPGFSTAAEVTDVSGRGVGMDVVKRNIQSMGGRIEIDSMPDFGTTMSIRLPLTLAIMDGMSVCIGEETYVVPLSFVLESLQPQSGDVKTIGGRGQLVNVRGQYLPIVALGDYFGISGHIANPEQAILVIVELAEARVALMVDDLIGQQQFVVKNLETNYRKVDGVSGATILGDGRVALILDISTIVRQNQRGAAALSQAGLLEQ